MGVSLYRGCYSVHLYRGSVALPELENKNYAISGACISEFHCITTGKARNP